MKRGTSGLYALLVLVAIGSCGYFISPAQAQGTASQPADPALQKWRQFGQNKANEAKAAAANLTDAEKEQARTLFATAFDLARQQNYDAARIAFQRGLAIDPANGQAEYYLAEVFIQTNDVKNALPHYATAMALAPTSPEGIKAEAALTQAVTKIQAAQQASQQAARQAAAAVEERRRQQAADEERQRQEARKHLVCTVTIISQNFLSQSQSRPPSSANETDYIDVLGPNRIHMRSSRDQTAAGDVILTSGDKDPTAPNLAVTVVVDDDVIKFVQEGTLKDNTSILNTIIIDRTTGAYQWHVKSGGAHWMTIDGTGSCQVARPN